ncbi:MAG TPA: maltose alpha-D-glucosyltransferase [Bryobacteraceae bacterium]|nr:maltose alpha-D-glucosyltransferase [Bryobacteraceae bacterium]
MRRRIGPGLEASSVKRPGSTSDPLWFKDAIIYELHVKAFADSNADGIGDLQGLIQKLDYLQDLGVTCIWVLPFFPSPLRDDGYDIADYMNVNPSYGTMDDFKAFLAAAHERDLQVMIELVINHTSDQHPWFQAARKAPPGSPERDYYVWSDTDQKYKDARIIFTDTEKSNWTWDPVAQAYFWHRFFSHQPDLNFDNPHVIEEVVKVMRFWLDMGVDGLRLDAIPYLVERDGTNCENLPETHVAIKQIRRAMDADYANRMILAEANQWPSDVRPYFGDGDECHMAFHFPVMPRIYMALRQEDRLPIVDIMVQTPDIPETCQWGLFLRNHDELTLEMVTNDERDYMYLAYSADPRTRINLGIRRRLAPLMDNNRRRIELLNSLLFSLPGTPIIYYGDEIGMGDNVYLGDRNGVRTPMQWNPDRNAGFSRANPAMLYSPVIMDPVWGYEAVNVEAQQSDPSSLLSWMRNMIALRKLFRVFGRGTLEFLAPTNRKILAYLRRFDGETVLCVTNLSRFAQPVDLDLAAFAGMVPVEMLGYVEFPPITRQPYRLTLGPYGFFWLELHGTPEPVETPAEPALTLVSTLDMKDGWDKLIPKLETMVLPEYLPRQRWFGGKSRRIQKVRVTDWAEYGKAAMMFLEVTYDSGPSESYFAPFILVDGVLQDALQDDDFCAGLLTLVEVPARDGRIVGDVSEPPFPLTVRRGSAEQSNSSITYSERVILKLFRRQQSGPNPDIEIGRYLSEQAHFDRIPPFRGSIEYLRKSGEPSAIAIVQGLVPNEGDGWTWTTEELDRYYETAARTPFPQDPESARDYVGAYRDAAAVLGRRTAELHLALSAATDQPAFLPEPFTPREIEAMTAQIRDEAAQAFDLLKDSLSRLPDEFLEMAGLALGKRRQIIDRLRLPSQDHRYGKRIRTHGDYHLGQVLRSRNDFVILDFEGEPARPLEQRRARYSPLKDVAGMLRSFSYAANATLMTYTTRHPEDFASLEPWARLWERTVSSEFLQAYRQTAASADFLPEADDDFRRLLDACLFEKAMYELTYELNNRPTWVRIPLAGILTLAA